MPRKIDLASHVKKLAARYGSFRELGLALGLDHTYLFRLARCEKTAPSDATLAALGLERVEYYRKKGGA